MRTKKNTQDQVFNSCLHFPLTYYKPFIPRTFVFILSFLGLVPYVCLFIKKHVSPHSEKSLNGIGCTRLSYELQVANRSGQNGKSTPVWRGWMLPYVMRILIIGVKCLDFNACHMLFFNLVNSNAVYQR